MRTTSTAVLCLSALSACLAWSAGCGSKSSEQSLPTASISAPGDGGLLDTSAAPSSASQFSNGPGGPATLQAAPVNHYPEVRIQTTAGQIRVKLDAKKAPQTVDNFLHNYVDRGFYDGTVLHYVEQDFIVIGGGYTQDLTPKETRAPIRNEANNGVKNVRGTVAMSRHPEYADSATSQFFINLIDNPALDYTESDEGGSGGYCVFGEVVAGMDVLDRIAAVQVHDVGEFPNVPMDPIVIESISRVEADAGP